jgi:uncharacterized protein YegP (UPF0339 family)
MRERHLSRPCRSCHAPIARQEASCWRCGVAWIGVATTTPSAVATDDRTVIARPDVDRWAEREALAVLTAVTTTTNRR